MARGGLGCSATVIPFFSFTHFSGAVKLWRNCHYYVGQPSSRSWRIRRCPSQLGGDTFGLLNQTRLLYVTTLLCQFLSVTAWNVPIFFPSLDPTESWRIFLFLWHVTGDLIEKIRVTPEISVKFKTPSFPHSVCCRAIFDWSQRGSDGWQSHCLPKISNYQGHLNPGSKDKLWTEGRV